jgi:hypothetical protein
MRRRWHVIPVVLSILAALVALTAGSARAASTGKADATGDANLSVANPSTNYGAKTPLDIKAAQWAALVRWNVVRDITPNVPAGNTVSMYHVQFSTAASGSTVNNGDTWELHSLGPTPSTCFTESTVTWNTTPSKGPLIQSQVIKSNNLLKSTVVFDIPPSLVNANGNSCYWLNAASLNSTRLSKAHAREVTTASLRPKMWADYAPTPTSAPPKLGMYRNWDGTALDFDPNVTASDYAELTAARATYGAFAGHARQFYAPGQVPLNSSADQLLADGWSLFINWKPFPSGQGPGSTCAGGYNTQIDAAASDLKAKAPAEIWVTLYHEADGDGVNYADYRCMWRVVQARFRAAGVSNVKWVMTYTGYEGNQFEFDDLWPGDAASGTVVDYLGHDPYINKDTPAANLGPRMISRTQWFRDNASLVPQWATIPVVFPEFGCELESQGGRGSDQHRADCYAGVRTALPQLASLGVKEIAKFDAVVGPTNNPPSVDGVAFQSLKTATES